MKPSLRSIVFASLLTLQLAISGGCGLYAGGIGCEEPDCMKPPAESNVNSYVCSCTCKAPQKSLEIRIDASSDDAVENVGNGAMLLTGTNVTMPFGANQVVRIAGLRFPNLQIPPGSNIVNAYVQFTASQTDPLVASLQIVGQAADNPGTFTTVVNDISSRPSTASSVLWSPQPWTIDANSFNQQTPNLAPILQEIIDRPGWAEGNAVALIISSPVPTAARVAYSFDGKPLNAPQLVVQFSDSAVTSIGPQDMPVCVPPNLNVNLEGTAPTNDDLVKDCKNRVQTTFTGLADACGYPSQCDCDVLPTSEHYSDKCDTTCVENPVEQDCSDFDPVNNIVEATNAPGDTPVCIIHSPLSFAMYGRRTTCDVTGSAHVEIEGESADPPASGIVQFRGTPCPEGDCAVDMEYRLDVGAVTFRSLFGSETFEDLAGLGESGPGRSAVISRNGDGRFGPGTCDVSARGRRGDTQGALKATNQDVVNFNVKFGSTSPSCFVNGSLLGSADPEIKRCEGDANRICTDDSQCAADPRCSEGVCHCLAVSKSQFLLGLDVAGRVVNQPPTADAGRDQTVECPGHPVLDASASSDLDSNLALFSWRLGRRNGPEVGFDAMSKVDQGLGTQTYFLRVIDTLGQTDEDVTTATVVDTTPPRLSCSVSTPVLTQTNHNLVNVGLSGSAHDACEGELPVSVRVFADEDDEMQTGDGNFSPDAKNIDVPSLRLRQERQGNGDGRVYLIVTEASDSSGNRGVDCCTVVVPQSASRAAMQSAQQQADAARSFCLAHAGAAPSRFFTVGDGPVVGPKQ